MASLPEGKPMIIANFKRKIIKNSSTWYLENINNMIVTNDAYRGLNVYNNNLEKIFSIKIMQGLIIETAYKNPNMSELLLYCMENNCFVYVNLPKQTHKVIKIPILFRKEIFSPAYCWEEDRVYIDNYNEHFFCINISRATIEPIVHSRMELVNKNFYNLFLCYKKRFFEDNQQTNICANFPRHIIGYKDAQQNYIVESFELSTKYNLGKIPEYIHSLEIVSDLIALAGEKCIYIFYKNQRMRLSISPDMLLWHISASIHKDMCHLFLLADAENASSYQALYRLEIPIPRG